MKDPTRVPVIVGIGEINDRPIVEGQGLDSLELMVAAARTAEQDAGGSWLEACDWLAITPQISFRQIDTRTALPAALGITPEHVIQPPLADGDSPVRHLSDAANAIGSGEASVCLLAGGEAIRTAMRRAAASGQPYTLFTGAQDPKAQLRRRYGLSTPTDIYPLYENACRAAWGQTLAEGQAETGRIWSLLSQVAAQSAGAWLKTPLLPAEITTITDGNRPIAFPYSKRMVANASVNQGAAVIVTSLAVARERGIADDRLVYIGAGASAHESDDPLARDAWTGSPSMELVLRKVLELNSVAAGELDHVELYSCFPCVPKLARRILGLSLEKPLTVHGGLTFGGGPIGNYMMHATVAMVRRLREGTDNGLLYGNGGFCTHNHALVLTRRAAEEIVFPQDYHYQHEADAHRGPLPPIGDRYEGPAMIDTYTVLYERDGSPRNGVVIAREPNGDRVLATVPGDSETIDFLTNGRNEPVGAIGQTVRVGDLLEWQQTR